MTNQCVDIKLNFKQNQLRGTLHINHFLEKILNLYDSKSKTLRTSHA